GRRPRSWRARAHAPHLEGGSHPACARDGGAAAAGVRPFPGRLQRGAAARGAGQPSSRCALSPLGATAAPTLAGDGLSGGLRAQARLASGADPLAPAAVLRERDPTPPGGGTEERGERVLGTLFRPRAPGRTGRRRERLETSRSLAQASPRPPLTCYPCGRSKMLPMCRAVPRPVPVPVDVPTLAPVPVPVPERPGTGARRRTRTRTGTTANAPARSSPAVPPPGWRRGGGAAARVEGRGGGGAPAHARLSG